jgi:hypothetical protein
MHDRVEVQCQLATTFPGSPFRLWHGAIRIDTVGDTGK